MDPEPLIQRLPVGILFVHGMGEQVQGDSVTEMGDALTEWLRKWLAPPQEGQLQDPRGKAAFRQTSPDRSR